MLNTHSIETRLHEHVLGAGQPHLANTGILASEWTDTYLQLVKEATQASEGQSSLPRKVVAAVYFSQWYLPSKYDEWLFNKGVRNEQTEVNLMRMQSASHGFLFSVKKADEGRAA